MSHSSHLLSRVFLFAILTVLLNGCSGSGTIEPSEKVFVDDATASGLEFVHHNGMSGEYYFNEVTSPGAALFDYDNDGDLDVYLVQGRPLEVDASSADSVPFSAEGSALQDVLYRNDLGTADDPGTADTAGKLSFTEVTEESRLSGQGYGMGVATGDVDNDGWTDLYVTNFGDNQLWRNNGSQNGSPVTFTEISQESGTGDARWSSSATFLDFDRDGWLDLYVVNYTDFRIANHKPCHNTLGAPEYCGPLSYRPEPDRLLRNLGGQNGSVSFEDVTSSAGILAAPGPGLGVVTADFDDDGWIDIYVANDQALNQLWMNQGDGTFRDEALLRGSAVDAQGQPQASMGVEAGDVDGDGDVDLFMTHLLSETNTLYLNDGHGIFEERSIVSGLATPSLNYTGFGTVLLDVDNDGWLDIMTVNGEVRSIPEQRAAGDALPLRQPNQLFHNETRASEVRFADWTDRAPVLALAYVSRGAAVGDIDNDGDADVLVQNNNGPTQLLINRVGARNTWLGVQLLGDKRQPMLGARVALLRPDALPLWRRVRSDASYLSANDPRVLFGLGTDGGPGPYRVEVRWPSGQHELFDGLMTGQYQDLLQGTGQPAEDVP